MEFRGRILRMLPQRSGTSQKTGNEWKAQPFVFEYFEHPNDRFFDKVLLETFDTNIIEKMKEGMECLCGFGHRIREYEGRTFNDVWLYKIELFEGEQKPAEEPKEQPQATTPQPPTEAAEGDDLPF